MGFDFDLKIAIIRSGKTQREVGLDARIAETRLSAIARGRAEPTPTERRALHQVLGIDVFGTEPIAEPERG